MKTIDEEEKIWEAEEIVKERFMGKNMILSFSTKIRKRASKGVKSKAYVQSLFGERLGIYL